MVIMSAAVWQSVTCGASVHVVDEDTRLSLRGLIDFFVKEVHAYIYATSEPSLTKLLV